ncbi:Cu/Ag efflux pump CusA [Bradyrhizobium sp. AZCC 1588]|uniref:hypothetical protein n=1 Tax=unclassified Bradyrhizobium TaxID=2631580 RepID=UPI002FF1E6AC
MKPKRGACGVSRFVTTRATASTVEGRQRFDVNMRYPHDLRSDPQAQSRDGRGR